jgi:hypothetical protein
MSYQFPSSETRFYNPGQRIQERIPYTNPTRDQSKMTNLSYFLLDAPEEDFFTVPSILFLKDAMGHDFQIFVPFPASVKRQFAGRGVVMIDPNHKAPIADEDNLATNDEDAKTKGAELYHNHLLGLVNDWFNIVNRAQSENRPAKPAQGTHKFALKALGLQDPAASVDNLISAEKGRTTTKEADERMKALEAQNAALAGQLQALMVLMTKVANTPDAETETSTKKNGK